ncbi:uncharacterized protein BDZ99DRAFT_214232 [Mytilinidion resinicola]|uniref:Uncharacterized protein n=1 Tax=Mytilinidion resinicola TaxID=574789 RepID=A0A6A6Y210_9PEZI|nr:uncharacterized protein BDZ99DRAFT_214232 [Mytilinidion resinicola]KAF2801847.1 hypothetical protein BDZ99DRAFT_214232 [Mytilinidion resinicola]
MSVSIHPPLELPFRFFDLPAELRTEIYDYILQDDTFIVHHPPSNFTKRHMRSRLCRSGVAGGFFIPHRLALLDTNQQARLELAPLVFSSKVQITMPNHTSLLNLTRNFGTLGLERITYLGMNMSFNGLIAGIRKKPSLRDMFFQLTGLKRLEISIYVNLGTYIPDPVRKFIDFEFVKALGLRELHAAGVKVVLKCVLLGARSKTIEWENELAKWEQGVVDAMKQMP